MRLCRVRFTVRRMMIAVAIVGGMVRVFVHTRGLWYESDRAWYEARANSFAADEESAFQRIHRCRQGIASAQAKLRAIATWREDVGRRPVGPFPVLDRDEETSLREGPR